MNKQDQKQLETKLRVMRFAPWCVLAAVALFGIPHYLDANEITTRLAGELLEAQEIPGQVDSLKRQLDEEQTLGEELRKSMVPAENLHDFRTRVVNMARSAGCKLRRMTEGARDAKPWVPGKPLTKKVGGGPAGAAPPAGGMQLETQELKVELTGSLNQLKHFLVDFRGTEAFVHTRTFSLSKSNGEGAKMELNLVLFNLTHAKPNEDS